LADRTVNIKAYTKREGILDINPNAPLDFYLILTGAPSALPSSRGTLRPFCIQSVFLFDAHQLHVELQDRGVKIGIATSVRKEQWEAAEVFPRSNNPLLDLTEAQRRQLEIFACD
jgi:hypothetical protein